MKFRLLLSFLLLFALNGFAQLSQQATVNYIEDKINECDGLRFTYYNPAFKRMSNLEFGLSKSDKNMIIFNVTHTLESGTREEIQYEFDPTHINGIGYVIRSTSDPVEFIQVQMTGKTVLVRIKKNETFTETNSSYFELPYLKIDPLNKERMRKAFLLLKKHYVAKKGSDPFAN